MSSDSSSSPPSAYFGSAPYSGDEEERISQLLRLHLSKEEVSSRAGNKGARFNYVEVTVGISLANAIFNFDGWSSSVQDVTVDFVDETRDGKWCVGISVILRVTLRNGAYHEDIGYGACTNMPDKGQAIEKAKKVHSSSTTPPPLCHHLPSFPPPLLSPPPRCVVWLLLQEAVSDALKRVLRLFGNKLGLSLADKEYMRKLQSGQIKTEPLDLDNPRKKQRLEESFNAATAPPAPHSAPAPPASPSSPSHPTSPQQPNQPPSTSPNRPTAAPGARPHFPLPNPFSTPAPAGVNPTNTAGATAPLAPYNRPPIGSAAAATGGPQKPRLAVPLAGGRETQSIAAAPPSPHSMNGQGVQLSYAAEPTGYSAPQWGVGAGGGTVAAATGPPLPLPSISGIIHSLQQPSTHPHAVASTPSMPYTAPTFTVKQEPVTQLTASSQTGYGRSPQPPVPMPRSPYGLPSSAPPPPFPTPPSTSPYTAPARPYHPPQHPQPFTATSMIDSSFPALPAGLGGLSPTSPRTSIAAVQAGAASSASLSSALPPSSSHPSSSLAVSPPMAGPSASGQSLLMDADDGDDSAALFDCILNAHSATPHAVQQTATT